MPIDKEVGSNLGGMEIIDPLKIKKKKNKEKEKNKEEDGNKAVKT